MNTEIKIRRATIQDAEALSDLSRRTFHDAFHAHPQNAPDDMRIYMDAAFSTIQMQVELADENAVFFIAEVENQLAGYVKLLLDSRETGVTGEKPIELCRLYSEQKFLGKGIGAALMEQSLQTAKEHDCDVIWLGVWEFNPRATAFYRKYDFEVCGTHVFQLGSDSQTDVLMQRKI